MQTNSGMAAERRLIVAPELQRWPGDQPVCCFGGQSRHDTDSWRESIAPPPHPAGLPPDTRGTAVTMAQ